VASALAIPSSSSGNNCLPLVGSTDTVDLALERRAFGGVPAQLNGLQESGPCFVATTEPGVGEPQADSQSTT
jgi:hypothetical protein